jgi:hypothetical protein
LDDVPRRAGARRGKSGSAGVILLGVASLLVLSCVLCAGAGAIVGWYALMIPPAPPKKNPIAVAAKDFGKVMVKEGIKGAGKGPFGDAGMGAKDFGNGLKGGIPAGKIILNQAGRLMPNDPVKEFKPHKAHTVRLEQGKTYVIDMVSTEMDSYLRLYNPAGVKIAEDDDGGGFPNARIRIMATQAGSYQIDATVFGGVGVNGASYVLTVREE